MRSNLGFLVRLVRHPDFAAANIDSGFIDTGFIDARIGELIDEARRDASLFAEMWQRREQVPVLLAGMLAPPNLGREYGETFNAVFPRLAEKHDVPLYPFFLDGVAAQAALNQGDGIHPNARGVEAIVERLAPYVIRALQGE